MSRQNIFFIIFGVILIGIALLTEYASTKLTSTWTMAKNDVPGSVRQPSVVCNDIAFVGTNGAEGSFPVPLQNVISGKIGITPYFLLNIEMQGRNL